MFFVYVSEEPDQKGKGWEYQIWYTIFFFFLYLQFLGRFFMYPDPDFQDRIWIFWPILIRTQEKSLIQIRTKGPWSETLNKRCHHSPVEQCWPPPGPGSGTVFPALVSLKHNNICKCNTYGYGILFEIRIRIFGSGPTTLVKISIGTDLPYQTFPPGGPRKNPAGMDWLVCYALWTI